MTIADSLTLLNSTKVAIKTAIEEKGVTVGSVPFADYPQKIMDITTGSYVTLNGPTTIYPDDSVTYTITNYNSFATYSVSVSAGSASISGDTINLTAPSTGHTIVLTVTVDGKQENFSIGIITLVVDEANVIGVALLAEGGDGGTWAHIDAYGRVVTNPGTDYFNSHPVFGGIQDVVIDGQDMVKVPKFYTKRGTVNIAPYSGDLPAWWISDGPIDGFELYPAFYDQGTPLDQFYVGKYQASREGSKLASKPGVLPAVNRSLTQFINDANARNVSGVSGFMLWSVYQWSAIQWLYLVENATMDSQAKTGQGRVSVSSAANVDAADVAQATYRGIVGLWGNARQWMDGLKTNASGIHLWDRRGNKTWVSTGKSRAAENSTNIYPNTFMSVTGANYNFGDVFIGDTGLTTWVNATAPDQQYFSIDTTERFPDVGGGWNSMLSAGLWSVYCNSAASSTSNRVGSRLAKV